MLSENQGLLPVIDSFSLSQVQEAFKAVRMANRFGKVLLIG